MPLPKQYSALLRAGNTSQMETMHPNSTDCFTEATATKVNGLTYPQLCELRNKHPEVYNEVLDILRDSAFD